MFFVELPFNPCADPLAATTGDPGPGPLAAIDEDLQHRRKQRGAAIAPLAETDDARSTDPELDTLAGFGDAAGMRYPGGKGGDGVFQTIINRMPPHRVYAEPFLGGGAVMCAKRPASLNIGIDRDPKAVNAVARAAIATHGEAGFRFEIGDALGFLRWYPFAGDELVYCDPPYLFETRNSDRPRYAYELGDDAGHHALLDILTALPCMVMLSGYWSQLYTERLGHWHSVQFQAMTHGGPRTEWLWCNFPEPIALHDYRYLGTGFREREHQAQKAEMDNPPAPSADAGASRAACRD